ncbi:MAG: hypothetical protein ACK5WS_01890 [Alphaproteobacteria bacterium]|jgi:hypothetical protein|nr:hypothetical protein [Candidatus Jidaibacter sp.]
MPLRLFISPRSFNNKRLVTSQSAAHRILIRVQNKGVVDDLLFYTLRDFIEALNNDKRLSAETIRSIDASNSSLCDIGIAALSANIRYMPHLVEIDLSCTGFTSSSEEFLYEALMKSSVVYLAAQGNLCDGRHLNRLILEKDSILYAKFNKLSKDCESTMQSRLLNVMDLTTLYLEGLNYTPNEALEEMINCKTALSYFLSNDNGIVSQKYPSTLYNLNRPDLARDFERDISKLSKDNKCRE